MQIKPHQLPSEDDLAPMLEYMEAFCREQDPVSPEEIEAIEREVRRGTLTDPHQR